MKKHPNDNTAFLMEYIDDKFTLIGEMFVELRETMITRAEFNREIDEIKSDIKAIKAALADASCQSNRHEDTFMDLGRLLRKYA